MNKTDKLMRTAGRGVVWQFGGAAWQTIIQLGTSVVLARLLFPEDFGMMGLAVLVQGFVNRSGDLSAVSGLIAKKEATQVDLSTAFWMGCLVKTTLFIITFSMAPFASVFFEEPKLTAVLRAVSITFIFAALSAVPGALLRKQLRFGVSKIIETTAFTIQSIMAILLVVIFDMNYWALVLSMLIASFLQTLALIVYVRWYPSLTFNRSSFRYLFRYAINGLGTSIIRYFQQNIDYILIGKLLGPAALGLYEFAYRIPHMAFNRLALPVGRVIFPTFSKIQTNDKLLASGYIKTARNMGIILFPALAGLAAVAKPAVLLLWGEKWIPVIVPLKILCFRSALLSANIPLNAVFMCKNRPDIPFKYNLYTFVFTCLVVGVLGWAFGLIGVATGMLISVFPSVILHWLALRLTNTPIKQLILQFVPPVISTAVSSLLALGVVIILSEWDCSNVIVLISSVFVGVLGYMVMMWFCFNRVTQELIENARVVANRH